MNKINWLLLGGCLSVLPVFAHADAPEPEEDPGSIHLDIKAKKRTDSKIIKSHYDLSVYHYIPVGVTVQEQPERSRILFQSIGHVPAGYAERKGEAIIYYDAQGQATRVQRLTPSEMDRIERR